MKGILSFAAAGLLAFSLVTAPECVLAAKGGVGNGGGTTDGITYHSHSDRSYSGRDTFKGKGHAYGRNKNGNFTVDTTGSTTGMTGSSSRRSGR